MRLRNLFLLLCFLSAFASQAQITVDNPKEPDVQTLDKPDSVLLSKEFEFFQCDQRAEYKGGDSALTAFIQNNVVMPDSKTGMVLVQFVIEKDGSVSNVQLHPKSNQISPNHHQAAIEVVRKTSGNWTPATYQGFNVRMKYLVPVRFGFTDPNLPKGN
ncbi:MAG: hypothetical protein GC181_04765 [Bacteroidetes bacterium]|nr:hypothetical protein [Bacteroidota bacterium]